MLPYIQYRMCEMLLDYLNFSYSLFTSLHKGYLLAYTIPMSMYQYPYVYLYVYLPYVLIPI